MSLALLRHKSPAPVFLNLELVLSSKAVQHKVELLVTHSKFRRAGNNKLPVHPRGELKVCVWFEFKIGDLSVLISPEGPDFSHEAIIGKVCLVINPRVELIEG